MKTITVEVRTEKAADTKPAACAVADAMAEAGFTFQSARTTTVPRKAIELTFQKSPEGA